MKYNERIREIREDNSLTQQKIADLLHMASGPTQIMKVVRPGFRLTAC